MNNTENTTTQQINRPVNLAGDLGGPPWRCPNCNRLNTDDLECCHQCGYDRPDRINRLIDRWMRALDNQLIGIEIQMKALRATLDEITKTRLALEAMQKGGAK